MCFKCPALALNHTSESLFGIGVSSCAAHLEEGLLEFHRRVDEAAQAFGARLWAAYREHHDGD